MIDSKNYCISTPLIIVNLNITSSTKVLGLGSWTVRRFFLPATRSHVYQRNSYTYGYFHSLLLLNLTITLLLKHLMRIRHLILPKSVLNPTKHILSTEKNLAEIRGHHITRLLFSAISFLITLCHLAKYSIYWNKVHGYQESMRDYLGEWNPQSHRALYFFSWEDSANGGLLSSGCSSHPPSTVTSSVNYPRDKKQIRK